MTTLCCAWRWTVVARGLGVRLSLPVAVAAYYRSLFLNLTLPGGVVGDVHRGVSHGRDVDDVGRGLRAVAWERAAGQVVQVVITVAVLMALPSPVRSSMPLVAVALAATVIVAVLVSRVRPRGGSSRWARLRNAGRRCPRRAADTASAAGDRARLRGRRHRPRGYARGRRAHRRHHRAAVANAAAGAARDDGHGAPQPRRLGAARGRDSVGVRRCRAGCGTGRRNRGRVRRDGARRQPARRGRPGRGLAPSRSAPSVQREPLPPLEPGSSADRRAPRMADRPYTLLSCSMSIDGYLGSARCRACCCRTTPTSTGSTPCAPRATRSWSARPPSGSTTRGCWCARRPAGTSGWPAGWRRRP